MCRPPTELRVERCLSRWLQPLSVYQRVIVPTRGYFIRRGLGSVYNRLKPSESTILSFIDHLLPSASAL
jgi:hypothetical protein